MSVPKLSALLCSRFYKLSKQKKNLQWIRFGTNRRHIFKLPIDTCNRFPATCAELGALSPHQARQDKNPNHVPFSLILVCLVHSLLLFLYLYIFCLFYFFFEKKVILYVLKMCELSHSFTECRSWLPPFFFRERGQIWTLIGRECDVMVLGVKLWVSGWAKGRVCRPCSYGWRKIVNLIRLETPHRIEHHQSSQRLKCTFSQYRHNKD